jgi:hypothetical protein
MGSQAKFNRSLLDATTEERLKYFVEYRSLHPQLKALCAQMMAIVRAPAGTDVIMVVGPTGAGKSTLDELLVKRITELALPTLQEDRGRIPVVSFKIPPAERGSFRWSDFYIRYLTQLENPLVPFCGRTPRGFIKHDGDRSTRIAANNDLGDLSRTVEMGLAQRRPMATIIDEAQHLMRVASGRKVLDHLDVIKAMADMSGVLHILIGTYDLVANLELNGQLSRRATTLHFPRYDANKTDDFLHFVSTLNEFQNHLPLAVTPDLLRNKKEIYAYCCGCVGILKNWLERALSAALERGAKTLIFADLQSTSLSSRQCLTIAGEITKGEAMITALAEGESLLYEQLGMPSPSESASITEASPTKAAAKKRTVGNRSPTRDPVGGGEKAA